MSEYPKMAIIGLSSDQVLGRIAKIKEWYGDFKGEKNIIIVDDELKDTQIQLASVGLETIEKIIAEKLAKPK